MRVRHGPRGLQYQAHARGDVGVAAGAVFVDGHAIDELEREVRPAIAADAGVVQARDAGMFERGEQVAFARHAPRGLGHRPAHVR